MRGKGGLWKAEVDPTNPLGFQGLQSLVSGNSIYFNGCMNDHGLGSSGFLKDEYSGVGGMENERSRQELTQNGIRSKMRVRSGVYSHLNLRDSNEHGHKTLKRNMCGPKPEIEDQTPKRVNSCWDHSEGGI